MICPIVGSKFHPPANAILAIIPVGQELIVMADPENQYTTPEFPNAIAVWIEGDKITSLMHQDEIDSLFAGYGFSTEQVTETSWHLGFIPKEVAKNIFLVDPVPGKFAVGSNGGPRVEFTP